MIVRVQRLSSGAVPAIEHNNLLRPVTCHDSCGIDREQKLPPLAYRPRRQQEGTSAGVMAASSRVRILVLPFPLIAISYIRDSVTISSVVSGVVVVWSSMWWMRGAGGRWVVKGCPEMKVELLLLLQTQIVFIRWRV